MKSKWLVVLGVVASSFGFGAQAFDQIEANLKYPVGMGVASSGYSPMLGFGASFYVSPMLDPSVPNYLSIGYQSYRIKADGTSSLKLIPIVATVELNGKVFRDFHSTLGVGLGVAASYVAVTGQNSFNWSAYFVAQIKPGFEWMIDDGISVVGHTPVSMFISRAFLSSMDFDLGVKFKL